MENTEHKFITVYSSLNAQLSSQSNDQGIVSLRLEKEIGVGLSGAGIAYFVTSQEKLLFVRIDMPEAICKICCNDTAALFLSEKGKVYSIGTDPGCYGILGTGCYESSVVRELPELASVAQISIGKSHAGALTSEGDLYLWGVCPSTSSTLRPSKHSIEVFTIQDFECGKDYNLLMTPGGYIYILGKLGYTHEYNLFETATRVLCPSELEKICIVASRAGEDFAVCLADTGEVYAFDGCMELVKLPSLSYVTVEDIKVVGRDIIGLCQDSFVIVWKMTADVAEHECKVFSYAGTEYSLETGSHIIGESFAHIVIGSSTSQPVLSTGDLLMPYKRTEFGRRLIEKARNSFRKSVSGVDVVRNSFEGSPLLKKINKYTHKNCLSIVRAINIPVKRYFSYIKMFYKIAVIKKRLYKGGLGVLFYKFLVKYIKKNKYKGLVAFKLNTEREKIIEYFKSLSVVNLSKVLTKLVLFKVFNKLDEFTKTKIIYKIVINIENLRKKQILIGYNLLKKIRTMHRFIGIIKKRSEFRMINALETIKSLVRMRKGFSILEKGLKYRLDRTLKHVFFKTNVVLIDKKVSNSLLDLKNCLTLNTLIKVLKKFETRHSKSGFRAIFHINRLKSLKKLLKSRFHSFLQSLTPTYILPSALNLQRCLVNSSSRQKLLALKKILSIKKYLYDDINFLSPIKKYDNGLNQRLDTSRSNFLDSPLKPASRDRTPLPFEAHDTADKLKNYISMWTEFKSKPDPNRKQEKTRNPPWKPSGINFKSFSGDSFKKSYERRRQYSESLRSSKSSMSSDESFCKKIGWNPSNYIKKIRLKKSQDLIKIIAVKAIIRTIKKKINRTWKEFKEIVKARKTEFYKKIIGTSWKLGLYSIGFIKFITFMQKTFLKRFWIGLASVSRNKKN